MSQTFFAVRQKPKSDHPWKMYNLVALLRKEQLITTAELRPGRVDGEPGWETRESNEFYCYRDQKEVAVMTKNRVKNIEEFKAKKGPPRIEVTYEHDESMPSNATIIETNDKAVQDFLTKMPQIRRKK